jgi:hypothetical protein
VAIRRQSCQRAAGDTGGCSGLSAAIGIGSSASGSGCRQVPPAEEPVRGAGKDRGRTPPLPACRRRGPVRSGRPGASPASVIACGRVRCPARAHLPAGRAHPGTVPRGARVSRPRALTLRRLTGAEPRYPDGAPVRERYERGGTARQAEHRPTRLDPYVDLVNQRWNEGVTSAGAIPSELRTLGFKGDVQTVRRYLKLFRLPGASQSHPDLHRRKPAPPLRPSRSHARSARRCLPTSTA